MIFFSSQYGLTDAQDYFQFAYEGISESEESTSRRNSNSLKDEEEEPKETNSLASEIQTTKSFSSKYSAAVYGVDWQRAASREEFFKLLDSLPLPNIKSCGKATIDQSIALIESRYQYFQEVRAEKEKAESEGFENNLFKLDLGKDDNGNSTQLLNGIPKRGLLITCTDEKG